jgi:hypothetical protein
LSVKEASAKTRARSVRPAFPLQIWAVTHSAPLSGVHPVREFGEFETEDLPRATFGSVVDHLSGYEAEPLVEPTRPRSWVIGTESHDVQTAGTSTR